MILDFGGGFFLRHAAADDHGALRDVCVKTGDAGADASWREDDPGLMGEIYAVPYQVLEPDHAFVIAGPAGVMGYLFAAPDTVRFNARLASEWYPALRKRLIDPGSDRSAWKGSDWARHAIHHPEFDIPAVVVEYPSHAHIDLMPPARRRGIGRSCMQFIEQRLSALGSTGLWLDVHPDNGAARRFYVASGYEPVAGGSKTSAFMAKRL
jgi:ribosomal protein S18 acetylase RimI-like enzyme